MSVSCKRGAHFQKFVFFMLGVTFSRFFDVLGCFGDSFWGAKVEPEWLRNSIQKWSDFWVAHSTVLGRQRGPHGSPRSPRGWVAALRGRVSAASGGNVGLWVF